MAGKDRTGIVVADVIEVRYAFGGKTVAVNKRSGDRVNKNEILASLSRKQLQTDLDKQLAQYEQQRAEFEIFVQKNPNPSDDVTMYLKKIQQAQLNVSVKEVELAKMRLDEADMFSPVSGIVVDDGGNRPGLYVTPSSNSFKVLDLGSIRIRMEIEPEEVLEFSPEKEIEIEVGDKKIKGKTRNPLPDGKKWTVNIISEQTEGLVVGVEVKILGV